LEILVQRIIAGLLLALFIFAGIRPSPAEQLDADVAKSLVGTWEWTEGSAEAPVKDQLILGGDGNFAFTSAMHNYRVTSTGSWTYEGGWLQFKTQWSSSLDAAGQPVAVGPIQVLEVGHDAMRTPAGIARRSG
jgi:hypothetical protein